jgi:hypothetical protein
VTSRGGRDKACALCTRGADGLIHDILAAHVDLHALPLQPPCQRGSVLERAECVLRAVVDHDQGAGLGDGGIAGP